MSYHDKYLQSKKNIVYEDLSKCLGKDTTVALVDYYGDNGNTKLPVLMALRGKLAESPVNSKPEEAKYCLVQKVNGSEFFYFLNLLRSHTPEIIFKMNNGIGELEITADIFHCKTPFSYRGVYPTKASPEQIEKVKGLFKEAGV